MIKNLYVKGTQSNEETAYRMVKKVVANLRGLICRIHKEHKHQETNPIYKWANEIDS